MAKESMLLSVIMWIVNILVSLAVGFGMISLTLSVPFVPSVIMVIAGWIVVIGILIGVLMAIIKASQ